jgi:hypothetical protein
MDVLMIVNNTQSDQLYNGYLVNEQSNVQPYSPTTEVKIKQDEFQFFKPYDDPEYAEWETIRTEFEGVVIIPPPNPTKRSDVYLSMKREYTREVDSEFSERIYSTVDAALGGLGVYGVCQSETSGSGLWNKVTSAWSHSKTLSEEKSITYFSVTHLSREEDYEFLKSTPQRYLSIGDKEALRRYEAERELLRIPVSHYSKKSKVPKCIKTVGKRIKNIFRCIYRS